MSSARFTAAMSRAEQAFAAAPEDDDILSDKPMGFCPWCNKELKISPAGWTFCLTVVCSWDIYDTEADNRTRFAKERQLEEQRLSAGGRILFEGGDEF